MQAWYLSEERFKNRIVKDWDVELNRLRHMCQYCHLNYDAKEKYKRSLKKVEQ